MDETPEPEQPSFFVPDDLGGWLDSDEGTTVTPQGAGETQVIGGIDPAPGSPYICQVLPTDDVAISLPREQAIAYGTAVLAVAHRAHYYAAVLAQARAILGRSRNFPGGDDEAEQTAQFMLGQLVDDLPELDDTATAPLRFIPTVHRRDGTALVRVSLPPHTEPLAGWTFMQARGHAVGVLEIAVVADLDTAYRTVVAVGFAGGEDKGRAAVADLANFYEVRDPSVHDDNGEPRMPPRPGATAVSGSKRGRSPNAKRKRR